jgi:hypothetical protein
MDFFKFVISKSASLYKSRYYMGWWCNDYGSKGRGGIVEGLMFLV